MKILIIEDDFIFGEKLKKLLDEKFAGKKNEIVIQKNITNLDLSQNYDYYFIDIMLDGENGINCGKAILDKNYFAKIIYMSSEDSLVYDTFVSKVYFFLRKENLIQDLERLWYKIEQDSIKNNDYIEIISKRKREFLLKKDIIYIESNRNKCQIYLLDGQYEVYKTLKSFLSELNADKFFRVNNYTIINLEYIKSVNNKRITLINDIQFTLKRNYNSFVDAYHNNYMKRFKQ